MKNFIQYFFTPSNREESSLFDSDYEDLSKQSQEQQDFRYKGKNTIDLLSDKDLEYNENDEDELFNGYKYVKKQNLSKFQLSLEQIFKKNEASENSYKKSFQGKLSELISLKEYYLAEILGRKFFGGGEYRKLLENLENINSYGSCGVLEDNQQDNKQNKEQDNKSSGPAR